MSDEELLDRFVAYNLQMHMKSANAQIFSPACVEFTAFRDIKKGDEIFICYGESYWLANGGILGDRLEQILSKGNAAKITAMRAAHDEADFLKSYRRNRTSDKNYGTPFSIGDTVRVMRGKHRGKSLSVDSFPSKKLCRLEVNVNGKDTHVTLKLSEVEKCPASH